MSEEAKKTDRVNAPRIISTKKFFIGVFYLINDYEGAEAINYDNVQIWYKNKKYSVQNVTLKIQNTTLEVSGKRLKISGVNLNIQNKILKVESGTLKIQGKKLKISDGNLNIQNGILKFPGWVLSFKDEILETENVELKTLFEDLIKKLNSFSVELNSLPEEKKTARQKFFLEKLASEKIEFVINEFKQTGNTICNIYTQTKDQIKKLKSIAEEFKDQISNLNKESIKSKIEDAKEKSDETKKNADKNLKQEEIVI